MGYIFVQESNHEEFKRKLFFGRLGEEINENKIIEMIERIRPNTKQMIEEDFPQVPSTPDGKSRIAFVLFKTHQIAKEVKESFKKLIERPSRTIVGCLDRDLKICLEEQWLTVTVNVTYLIVRAKLMANQWKRIVVRIKIFII